MASTNGGPGNEFLEKAHLKAHACRAHDKVWFLTSL